MRKIKAIIEYDGTNYNGFQKQLNQPTIQGVLENCLSGFLKEEIHIQGSGRTDSGTHALAQVISFQTSSKIPIERMRLALQGSLPKDILIKETVEVGLDFHPQHDASLKHYVYKIYNAPVISVFWRGYAYFVPMIMDEELFRKACQEFKGTHNFKAFAASAATVKSFTRTICHLELIKKEPIWEVHIKGNGFLQHMVRIIVGTIVEIALEKRQLSSIADALRTGDRKQAGPTLPAYGLYLYEVKYKK